MNVTERELVFVNFERLRLLQLLRNQVPLNIYFLDLPSKNSVNTMNK